MLSCTWSCEPRQAGLLRSSVTSVGSTTPVADYLTLLSDTSEDMLVKASKVHQRSLTAHQSLLAATHATH